MQFQAPVVTSINQDQLASLLTFMEELRGDNKVIASLEIERLAPYMRAFSTQLKRDMDDMFIRPADAKAQLAEPENLHGLFNAVAHHTRNTILSEMTIMPESALEHPDVKRDSTQFAGRSAYDGQTFTLAFIQVFGDKDRKTSVSLPLFAFQDKALETVADFAPERMLRAFQTVMSAGNHDMQHHYTSQIVNSDVTIASVKDKNGFPAQDHLTSWSNKYFTGFSDTVPTSYECWLMLNHARIRRVMEDGPEGEDLKRACNEFFDELGRISKDMQASDKADKAHRTIDYFGTMLCFSMMRFMPLDHPLIDHAIARLEEIDPDPSLIRRKTGEVLNKVDMDYSDGDTRKTIANYKEKGVALVPDAVLRVAEPAKRSNALSLLARAFLGGTNRQENLPRTIATYQEQDYKVIKKLQLVLTAPWIAHLLSPAVWGSDLAKVQNRVAKVNQEMISASAASSWYSPKDGVQFVTQPDGSKIETYYKNGLPHRDDGPAITVHQPNGAKTEIWCKEGEFSRDDGPAYIETYGGSVTEKWYHNGVLGRDDGPCIVEAAANGLREETWKRADGSYFQDRPSIITTQSRHNFRKETWLDEDGLPHREGAPAIVETGADYREEHWHYHGTLCRFDGGPSHSKFSDDGTSKQEWKKGDSYHREDGPAYILVESGGEKTEMWYKHGLRDRTGAPAYIKTGPDGFYAEKWYQKGRVHREDGPAHTETRGNGAYSLEEWYIKAARHRDGAPAYIEKRGDLNYTERWHQHDHLSRDDGPAEIITREDGTHIEKYMKDGRLHRENGPAYLERKPDGREVLKWYKEDQLHNEDGPAYTVSLEGKLVSEHWYKEGRRIKTVNHDTSGTLSHQQQLIDQLVQSIDMSSNHTQSYAETMQAYAEAVEKINRETEALMNKFKNNLKR